MYAMALVRCPPLVNVCTASLHRNPRSSGQRIENRLTSSQLVDRLRFVSLGFMMTVSTRLCGAW